MVTLGIMNARNFIFVCIASILKLSSCSTESDNNIFSPQSYALPEEVGYTFFVAGHTYGNPMEFQYGLHPPFKTMIPQINAYPKLEFGILTGDVVPKPTVEYWDAAEADIDKFKVPIHIAPGNHDKSPVYHERYPDPYEFNYANDLFFILSPRNWNIDGEQLAMVKSQIDSCKATVDNIFIFCHELIWWSPDNQFGDVEVNYRPHFPGSISYWDDFQPYLDSLNVPVYLIAGDIGASDQVDPFMYAKEDNIRYVASGMGSNIDDNMIFVEVTNDGVVELKMVGVQNHQFGWIQSFK